MMRKLISAAIAIMLVLGVVASTSAEIEKVSTTEVVIDGNVTEYSYLEFVKATADKNVKHWTIIINTNGGEAYATIGIMNRILWMKSQGVEFTTFTETKAMSAGGYIFLMGDKRIAVKGSTLMFHTILQQKEDYEVETGRVNHPSTITMIERMDNLVGARFKEVTGCGKLAYQYWIHGRMPDGSRVREGAQYMSALTAFNINVATHFVDYENLD